MNTQNMINDLIDAGFSTYGICEEVNLVLQGRSVTQPTIYRNWKGQVKRPRRQLITALHHLHQKYRPDLYGKEGPLNANVMVEQQADLFKKVVNLTDIIDYTAYACRQPRPVTNSACQVMLEHIAEHLTKGHTVQLNGFGSLVVVTEAGKKFVEFKSSKKLLTHKTPNDPQWPFSGWTSGGGQ